MATSSGKSKNGGGKKRASGVRMSNGNGDTGVPHFPSGQVETTGRYLVLFREGATESGMRMLSDELGASMVRASSFEGSAVSADSLSQENIVMDTLGIAVVSTPPAQFGALSALASGDSAILAIEPERVVYAIDAAPDLETLLPQPRPISARQVGVDSPLRSYLRGYQSAVDHLVNQLIAPSSASSPIAEEVGVLADESAATWGLQATNVLSSRFTGKGVRVAILDTGLDFGHPDFVGRSITSQSFITGESADDGHGHGTHCTGTACGSKRPTQLPRYGIASDAEIFIGKVLSNAGSGADGGILAGIEWAIVNKCAVVSMSLGGATFPGQSFSSVYEIAAQRALAAGTLIIAAAGNESDRPDLISPVSHPANCPSIIAVGAIDEQRAIAPFSCGDINGNGGQVDIAGPGVAVHSTWTRPRLYRTISGTSMATPHVAGIAALYAENHPAMRGASLGWLLLQNAQRLNLPTSDVGAGLVQAP